MKGDPHIDGDKLLLRLLEQGGRLRIRPGMGFVEVQETRRQYFSAATVALLLKSPNLIHDVDDRGVYFRLQL